MSYQSKYTGNEIDELLDKIKSSDANVSKTTLAVLKKNVEGIKANVSFDMDILANTGLEVSENNRIVLKAGKTYIVRYAVEYLGSSASSNVQLGFATNFEAAKDEDKFTYLYSNSLSSTWGNSGEKDIVVTPNEDTELTFITSQYTSSTLGQAWVKCIVESIIETSSEDTNIKEIYSIEETKIGTWIDGKPLYRKVVLIDGAVVGTVSAGSSKILDHAILDAEYITIVESYLYISTSGDYQPLNTPSRYAVANATGIKLVADAKISATSAHTFGFVIHYTKTTDSAN